MLMTRIFLILLISISPALANNYQVDPNINYGIDTNTCPEFFKYNVSDNNSRSLLTLCNLDYAVIYDPTCKIPLVVFENLRSDELDGTTKRRDNFRPDPRLHKEDSATLSDYRHSGVDRGHMVPAGDMKENSTSMGQTFYLSNIIPQYPNSNRGIWKTIEDKVRKIIIAQHNRDVFVITGALLGSSPKTIGNGVCIPYATFKIIITPNKSFGFVAMNRSKAQNRSITPDNIISPAIIMRMSGFNFTRK